MISRSVRRQIRISFALARSWRPTGAKLVGFLRSMATSFIALGVTFVILPGRQSSGPAAVLLLVITVAAVGIVLRPLLLGLTVVLGAFGLLVVGVLAQAAILAVAVSVAPDVHITRMSTVVGASWIAATVAAVVNWLLDSGTQDAYLAQTLGRVVRITHRNRADDAATGAPGLVIVQLDGVGRELLRQAMVSGAVPTLSRWLRGGSYRGYRWNTGLPATTPAGQAVLLHGDRREIPSFRWFEKDGARLMVANRAADAAEIERRMTTGRGLLADGGVSVSNLFSGDAPTRILTMSDARLPSRSTRGLASFATTSMGFVRTLVVFAGQVVAETYQARRQRRRNVLPRVHRGGQFALLRGVTTALLHDLNVAIVAEQMARSAPVVFVDFVDYDEIAHHAGPSRPEAMRTLDALDRVLLFLEQVAAETNRRYEIVVVSDHGQSQGTPFAELVGQTLQEVVDAAVAGPGTAARADRSDDPAEQWSAANLLLTSAARSRGAGLGSLARRKVARAVAHSGADEMTVNLGRRGRVQPVAPRPRGAPVVAAAGSLGHVYLPELPGRATRETIDRVYPGLVDALATHPGIGLVLVRSSGSGVPEGSGALDGSGAPIVIGAAGWRVVGPDGPTGGAGDDPLVPYGSSAARDLFELDSRRHVGDLVVLGRYDPETGELAAFEELVGSHGGLGGDQTSAVLLVPASWPPIAGPGAPAPGPATDALTGVQVHEALVARLRALGLRPGDEAAPSRTPGRPQDVPTC